MENLFGKILFFVTTIMTSFFGGSGNVKTFQDFENLNLRATATVSTDWSDAKKDFKNDLKNVSEKVNDTVKKSVGSISGNNVVVKKENSQPEDFYGENELANMSSEKFKQLILGDKKYTTDKPEKGSIFLCNVRPGEGGAFKKGPWINEDSWSPDNKIVVTGNKSWKNATFSMIESGIKRNIASNGLPINHSTGIFPISSGSKAYSYDRNPNSILPQNLSYSLPLNPEYSETPYCIGGEVGILLSGVPLFNGFDAMYRDAQAHEIQDSCGGHPERNGKYHYHGLSDCFKDISVNKILGYALDGFPITGPKVSEGKYLTTEDLDICHGLVSELDINGEKKATYHYVLTQDFPYSISCFRGKPIQLPRPSP